MRGVSGAERPQTRQLQEPEKGLLQVVVLLTPSASSLQDASFLVAQLGEDKKMNWVHVHSGELHSDTNRKIAAAFRASLEPGADFVSHNFRVASNDSDTRLAVNLGQLAALNPRLINSPSVEAPLLLRNMMSAWQLQKQKPEALDARINVMRKYSPKV
jgi:hypothetical protein